MMMESQTDEHSLPNSTRRVRRDAEALAGSVQEAAGQIEHAVAVNMRERPWTTIAVAAGAGFVLGGGLATRTTRILLGMGGRLAFTMLLQEMGKRAGLNPTRSTTNDTNRRNS